MPLKMHYPRNLLLLAFGLMIGCATSQAPHYTAVSTDYVLQVQQVFDELPNGTYLDFQQGQRIQPGNLDRWSTYCRLYVYNPDHGADYRTSVEPGTLRISAVKADYHSSDYPPQPHFGQFSWGVRDLPAYYLYQVGMRLNSPDQPEVRSLVCYKKWAVPRVNQYPTLAEIRAALGDQLKLDLPG
jgi:hypothetical protein